MKISEFRQNLKLVFDDDLRTRPLKWHNYVDIAIVGVILVSTLEVFLSTFDSVTARYGNILNVINWFTVVFFTVEIALRIWTADLLDEKYKGFKGRLRYCCSFYGLVDIVSTVPFYINFFLPTPYAVLKVVRVFRLLRLFRYMKSSHLLIKAVSSKKNELLTSISFLALLTVILSFLLYFVEHSAQPELCENGWQSLMWAFAKYLGDPGKIADFTLMTPAANFIAFLVGILGVAIFAVPTGLISSGFVDAMDEEKRENELKELRVRIRKAFRRDKDKLFSDYLKVKDDLYFVPQEIPVYKLQARQNMDLKDIIDCCKEYPEIRLKNMAQIGTTIEDLFVVEQAYLNRCYGACIDRKSRVTIVSTSSYAEKGTGWFAYYLALFGNFNFISKDVEVDVDDQDPFYNLNHEPRHDMKTLKGLNQDERSDKKLVEKLKLKQAYRDAYFKDLYDCCKNRQDSWFIVVKEHKTSDPDDRKIYLTANKKDGSLMMIDDAAFYNALCQDFSELMKTEEALDVIALSDLYSLKEGYVINQMTKKVDVSCNSFVMRPASDVMNNARKLIVAHRIARFLSAKLDGDRDMCREELKEEGFGFKIDTDFEESKKKAEEEAKKMA